MIELNDTWNIVTAFAERCRGSGWVNPVVWVVIQKPGTNKYELRCIQPEDQTEAMRTLFDVSAACSESMVKAVVSGRYHETWEMNGAERRREV